MWFICMPLNPTALFKDLLKSISYRTSSFSTNEENRCRKSNCMVLMEEFLQINKDQIRKAGRAARRAVQAWCSSRDPRCVSSLCHRRAAGALSFYRSLPACLMYLAAVGKLAGAMKKPRCIKEMQEWLAAESSSAQLFQAQLGNSFCLWVPWPQARVAREEVELGFALRGLVLGNTIQWWFRSSSCLIWILEFNNSFARVSQCLLLEQCKTFLYILTNVATQNLQRWETWSLFLVSETKQSHWFCIMISLEF